MNRTTLHARFSQKSLILLPVICQAKPEPLAQSLRFLNDHKRAMTYRSLEGQDVFLMSSHPHARVVIFRPIRAGRDYPALDLGSVNPAHSNSNQCKATQLLYQAVKAFLQAQGRVGG